MSFSLAEDILQTVDLCGENAPAQARQTIITTPGIFIVTGSARFLYQSLVHHFLKIVIKRAGADLVLALRLLTNLLHDGIAVPVLVHEREQDMECGRREWEEG